MNLNRDYFTPDEIDSGFLWDAINLLRRRCKASDQSAEIRIRIDGDGAIMESSIAMSEFRDEVGRFEFLEEGDEVFEEAILPDRSVKMVPKGTAGECKSEWLKEHPSWHLTAYGTWTDDEENSEWAKYMAEREYPKDDEPGETQGDSASDGE